MKLKQLLPTFFLLFITLSSFAQNQNPFASIGKKGKILTLTKGNYDEFFDKDSIQQIGSSLINIHTLKVVKLLTADESKKRLESEKHSRFLSVDPLTYSFPWYTPYQFAGNMPIVAVDLDGLEEYIVTNYYNNSNKIGETQINKITDKNTKQRINMQLIRKDGSSPVEKNVLVKNVKSNGKTSYAHLANLNKEQQNIVNKAKKIIIKGTKQDEKWHASFGDDKAEGEFLKTKDDNFSDKNYEFSEYSSNDLQVADTEIKNLKPSFSGIDYYSGTTQILNTGDGKNFLDLPNKIRQDGSIKSINIKIPIKIEISLTASEQTKLVEQGHSLATAMVAILKKSGVTNVTYSTANKYYNAIYNDKKETTNLPKDQITVTLNRK